jgi:predicted nucleic acid-binding protein
LTLFVDTSVWSLAFRRDAPEPGPEVHALLSALEDGDTIVATGIVLQELLQGFSGPKSRKKIMDRFAAVPLVVPDREDHVQAAEIRNRCRRSGIQVGTIDALLASLCVRHTLTLLTADSDFRRMTQYCNLKLWLSR